MAAIAGRTELLVPAGRVQEEDLAEEAPVAWVVEDLHFASGESVHDRPWFALILRYAVGVFAI